MMNRKKDLLLRSAARLYSLGVDLEGAKERVRKLAAQGVGCESAEMIQAVEACMELQTQWDNLEREHRKLRDEILKENP